MDNVRHLHVLGATGAIRTALHAGRAHIVVPVVALMEGVIHAINAETPEFVPFKTLAHQPERWNGQPVVLNHPSRNGIQISAKEPGVLDAQGLGTVFKTCTRGKKLCLEAWIDPEQASKTEKGRRLLERVKRNEQIEVSVGAYVTTLKTAGTHNGKSYKAEWQTIEPDHIAFLPEGVGACSIEMGCGAHRAAAMSTTHLVTAQGYETLDSDSAQPPTASFQERLTSLLRAAGNVYDDSELRTACECKHKGHQHMKTKQERIAALIGNTHNTVKDIKVLEAASDEVLTALEAAAKTTEEAATKLTAAETAKTAAETAAAEAVAAKATAEAALKTAQEAPITIDRLTPELKQIVADHTARDTAEKTELITSLKTAAAGAYSEAELTAMDTASLRKLATLARVEAPAPKNYAGNGVVRPAPVSGENYAPPDPYAAGIKALQASGK
jgi:hypothetical protein